MKITLINEKKLPIIFRFLNNNKITETIIVKKNGFKSFEYDKCKKLEIRLDDELISIFKK